MKKHIAKILIGLITISILAAANSYVKVNVLEERVQNNREILTEIKNDVKYLIKAINEADVCCKARCKH